MWKWAPGPAGPFTYGSNQKIYVNDNILTGDTYTTAIGNNLNTGNPSAPLSTLDFAVSVAQPGDTIFVDAGTYAASNFGVGNGITVLGPNYNISPNNPLDKLLTNPARNAEATISGATITIAGNNISFEGLTFDPGNKSIFVLSNTSITNNDFRNFRLF